MRRLLIGGKAFTATGLVLFLVAGGLVATVGLAAASGRTITVSPSSDLQPGQQVTLRGKGFARLSLGAILECNITPGEPVYAFILHGDSQTVPVGCTSPRRKRTSSRGVLGPVNLTVETGTLGAADPGMDSAGNQAATDSALYPCPPTADQIATGGSCVFESSDNRGQLATIPVTFFTSGGTTSTTTTTQVGCDPSPVTVTGTNPSLTPPGTPTLTVNPGTCLVGGTIVSLTGSGYVANSLGLSFECNSDPDQPTVDIGGGSIPVSCSNPYTAPGTDLITTSSTGALGPAPFTVIQGVVGPPCDPNACTTDSSGGSPTADAADYPCPPTPAQVAKGDHCEIVVGDAGGDSVEVPISYDTLP
jgi:hypothetical protein